MSPSFFDWAEDETLTRHQHHIKWYIWTEIEWEDFEDLKIVFESLLKDVNAQIQSSKPKANQE